MLTSFWNKVCLDCEECERATNSSMEAEHGTGKELQIETVNDHVVCSMQLFRTPRTPKSTKFLLTLSRLGQGYLEKDIANSSECEAFSCRCVQNVLPCAPGG